MTILRTSDALTRPSYPYQEQSSDQYIRGSNTQPEMLVRSFLFAQGFRYCLHVKDLPGKPDIVLSKYKTVNLVNGCFWYGHKGCRYFVLRKKQGRNRVAEN